MGFIFCCKLQRIPKWWVWYYWICPVAWTVYGLLVSQYRDVEDPISVPGLSPNPSIKNYIQDYYGYDPDFMGPVAANMDATWRFGETETVIIP